MRVYLDACCLSRLTDDQSQPRVRAEADAIERILARVRLGIVELVSSEALEDEVSRIPSMERRVEVETLLTLATATIEVNEAIARRAGELNQAGYGTYDALHLSAAEAAGAEALLSTDDGFTGKAARGVGAPRIPVRNPLSWNRERER